MRHVFGGCDRGSAAGVEAACSEGDLLGGAGGRVGLRRAWSPVLISIETLGRRKGCYCTCASHFEDCTVEGLLIRGHLAIGCFVGALKVVHQSVPPVVHITCTCKRWSLLCGMSLTHLVGALPEERLSAWTTVEFEMFAAEVSGPSCSERVWPSLACP